MGNVSSIKSRWSNETKLIVSLLLVAFFIYLIIRFRVILPPLILAVILAILISPVASFFSQRLHISRTYATLLCYLILVVVLITLPIGIIPLMIKQEGDLNLDIQQFIQQLGNLLGHQYQVAGVVIDGQAILQQIELSLRGLVEPFVGRTLMFVVDIITSFVWVIFIGVVSFYLVKDAEALRKWLEGLPPQAYRQDFVRLRADINLIWASFFRGQLILAIVVSILFTVIGFAIGLPFAMAMGLFAGLMEFLPSIGHGIWLVTASILALLLGSTWIPIPSWAFTLIVIGLHLFYQQFDLNYLIPRIIGRSVHLPPLVVILGIFTGAVFAGVIGIWLAAPTIASIRVLGRYIYANLLDMDPFPENVVSDLPAPNPRFWRLKRSKGGDSSEKEA